MRFQGFRKLRNEEVDDQQPAPVSDGNVIDGEAEVIDDGFGEEEIAELLDLSDEVEDTPEIAEDEETPEVPAAEEPEPEVPEPEVPETPEVAETPETPTVEEPEAPAEEQPNHEEQMKKWTEELEAQYQVSSEQADMFVTEPEKVLPQFAAMVHQKAVQDTLQSVARMMPQLMQNALAQQPQLVTETVSQQQAAQDAENKFFEAFPELKDHGETAMQAIKMVREVPANKGLTTEELIVKGGNAAMAMLGLTKMAPAPEPAPQQQPFIPASPGAASGAAPQQAPSMSEWDELIEIET